jgi:CheY-like chemotaxis protein
VHVLADRQRLKQVLLNLLSNAIKYNKDNGSVAVSYAYGDGNLRLAVTDTGPGIPEDKMDGLFLPFERLGAEASEVEGTGLGLALSKNLVQVMGGVLSARSTIGAGSTFSIELPLVDNPLESVGDGGDEVRAKVERIPAGAKILYIEDNLSNLRLIEQVLKMHSSAQLITAMQGRLGLDLARKHRPDIVLLDLHLPDIPGEEVLRRLRSNEETRHLPIVMISADATKRSVRTLLEQGATEYLTKPLDIAHFLDVLADNLHARVG